MLIEVLILVAVLIIGFIVFGFFFSVQLRSFQSDRQVVQVDLANKQQAIEKLVMDLQNDLQTRQQEIRAWEQDRTKKFAELTTTLDHQRQMTQQLQVTTQQLASVLSNNQARGGWGERILDDLLRANGLVEGVHYQRQLTQTTGRLRPDFTLLLPNKRTVPIDVKFPYAEIQKLAQAEGKAAKDIHAKQFLSDVRSKIRKVAEYIQPNQDTLDYALLFVPNEMIFSFINQQFPEVIDEAMQQRVLLVSPFTVLVVARTILESYRNFMIEDKLRDIIGVIGEFRQEWQKFQDEFRKFGRAVEAVRSGYDLLVTTRTSQMERKLIKIDEYQASSLTASVSGQKTLYPEPTLLPTQDLESD